MKGGKIDRYSPHLLRYQGGQSGLADAGGTRQQHGLGSRVLLAERRQLERLREVAALPVHEPIQEVAVPII